MEKEYTVEENEIIWYEENGFRISFMQDLVNPDYQEYLNSREDKAAKTSTKKIADE